MARRDALSAIAPAADGDAFAFRRIIAEHTNRQLGPVADRASHRGLRTAGYATRP
jgi:hypothetical protein